MKQTNILGACFRASESQNEWIKILNPPKTVMGLDTSSTVSEKTVSNSTFQASLV